MKMTQEELIKFDIQREESRLDAHHYESGKGWVSATGQEREMILANIKSLKARLPQARYDDEVARYGWKSVERNA